MCVCVHVICHRRRLQGFDFAVPSNRSLGYGTLRVRRYGKIKNLARFIFCHRVVCRHRTVAVAIGRRVCVCVFFPKF